MNAQTGIGLALAALLSVTGCKDNGGKSTSPTGKNTGLRTGGSTGTGTGSDTVTGGGTGTGTESKTATGTESKTATGTGSKTATGTESSTGTGTSTGTGQAVNPSKDLRAFPGAEGAGAFATGGRDGDVYYVTSLADSGPGTLRDGIDTTPATGRTILFKVGGYVDLKSGIQINKPNITIAGQTAPGDGITVRNYSIYVGERPPRKVGAMLGNNLIFRHMHLRLGVPTQAADQLDNLWICSGENVIIDHVSSSWSADEVLSANRDVKNLTVQHSLMAEPLNKDGHGFGSVIGSGFATNYSWHHNLWAHCSSRNPRPSSEPPEPSGFQLDFRNNVIYDPGYRIGYNTNDDRVDINYVNNYIIAGPSTAKDCILESGGATAIYQSGNLRDMDKDGVVDGVDGGWGMFCGSHAKKNSPFTVPPVTTEPAEVAYQRILATGGATPWKRDAVDKRIVGTVRSQTGKVINVVADVGGFPALDPGTAPEDSDNDGMPDYWEQAMALNPSSAADGKAKDATGYTNLEHYLNWVADGHAVCKHGGSVDVDLQTLNGGSTNLTFTVASGVNGSVTLLPDGYTARFTAGANGGLANFSYTAKDKDSGVGFGPVSVGVLITP